MAAASKNLRRSTPDGHIADLSACRHSSKAAVRDERRVARGLCMKEHDRRDRGGKGGDEQQSGQPLHPAVEIVRRCAAR